jgi:hypothetical protein
LLTSHIHGHHGQASDFERALRSEVAGTSILLTSPAVKHTLFGAPFGACNYKGPSEAQPTNVLRA